MTTTPSMIDAKTVSRIRKLLALAEDGGATEAEAATAMSMAQAEMAKHNLTMAVLIAGGQQAEGRVKEKQDRNLMYVWKRDLLETVASVNFCFLAIKHERTKSGEKIAKGYDIIGRQSNVVATKQMFEYLLSTIEHVLRDEIGTSDPRRVFDRWSHTFRLGCSNRLRERLSTRHEELLAEQEREAKARTSHPAAATGNALVVVMRDYASDEQDLNEDLRHGLEPGTTTRRRAEWKSHHAQAIAEREAVMAQRLADAKAAGASERELAAMRSWGVSLEMAREALRQIDKPETDAQRRKREQREANDHARWHRQRRKEQSVTHSEGYRAGERRGEGIGLDQQIAQQEKRRLA